MDLANSFMIYSKTVSLGRRSDPYNFEAEDCILNGAAVAIAIFRRNYLCFNVAVSVVSHNANVFIAKQTLLQNMS